MFFCGLNLYLLSKSVDLFHFMDLVSTCEVPALNLLPTRKYYKLDPGIIYV